MHSLGKRIKVILGAAAAGALLASAVLAGPPIFVQQQNPYIWVKLGGGGQCHPVDRDLDVSGRWAVGTVVGNPESDRDDNLEFNYYGTIAPCWHHGYTTLQIDGANTVFGSGDGSWQLSLPYVGATGWYVTGTWLHTKSNVAVTLRLSIIRDQARFEYTIKNNDTNSHTVGLRMLGDVEVRGLPGEVAIDWTAYPYVPGMGFVNTETDLTGSDIPAWFDFYDDNIVPGVGTRNTVTGQDCTRPDRIALGEYNNMQSNDWTYTPVPDKAVNDWAWIEWWNPITLGPGQQRKIVTYYGVSAADESWTRGTAPAAELDRFCVALQAPLALSYDSGSVAYPSNNEFLIKGYVYNLWGVALNSVSAYLSLPKGLELVEGSATQTIKGAIPEGTIPPEKESSPVVWKVRATGTVSGPLKYSMLVTANGLTQRVERTIVVPATLSKDVVQGWQLVSLPFQFRNPVPSVALTFNPATEFEIQAYDPDAQAQSPYKPLDALQPGLGFWLKAGENSTLNLQGDATALAGSDTYRIDLSPGWNLFGNPYVFPVCWGRATVINGTARVSIEEAALRGWVRRTFYWWNTDANQYQWLSEGTDLLQPFQGYWIKSLTKCQLVIPPVDQIGAGIVTSATVASRAAQPSVTTNTKDNWRLGIAARAGDAADTVNLLGVDTRASDGYDPTDVERPPFKEHYVSVCFPHRDWGSSSGSFVQDIRRSAGAPQSWDMEVTTDMANTDVVLTWPDLGKLPRDVALKLVDVDANTTKYMRTTSSYRYNSGSATTRRFKIVAEAANAGRLLITGLNVAQSRAVGGATVSYALSTDATTDVRVRSLSGKTVRNLATGRSVTRGITNLSWNYRNAEGEPVPAGSYIVEVVATTPEGEVAKDVRPFIVAR